MYSTSYARRYQHIGRDLSFYPFHNRNGGLNLVSGEQAVASRILTVLLTQPGEDPMNPHLRLAPKLFEPLSYDRARYFVAYVQDTLLNWNRVAKIGFEQIEVDTIVYEDGRENKIAIRVLFRVAGASTSVLTFGYWEYLGANHQGDLKSFIQSVSLNGLPFTGFGNLSP